MLHPIIRRWIDLTVLTAIGVLVCLMIHKQLYTLSVKFVSYQEIWPLYIQFLMVTLIAGVLWLSLIHLGGFHVKHLRISRLVRYPPTWVAGIIGTFVYLVITQDKALIGEFGLKEFFLLIVWKSPILLGFTIATVLSILFGHWSKRLSNKASFSPHDQAFGSIANDPHQLLLWIEDESPIYSPNQDLFGLTRISRRISFKIRLNIKRVIHKKVGPALKHSAKGITP